MSFRIRWNFTFKLQSLEVIEVFVHLVRLKMLSAGSNVGNNHFLQYCWEAIFLREIAHLGVLYDINAGYLNDRRKYIVFGFWAGN